MSVSWQPILAGREAARALAAIDAIAHRLAEWPAFAQDDRFGASLATGDAGLAVLFSYLDRVYPHAGYADLAAERLEGAVDRLATSFHLPGLYQGFAGIAWTVEHLRDRRHASGAADLANLANHASDASEASDARSASDASGARGANDPSDASEASDADDPNTEIDRALFELLARTPWRDAYDLTSGLVGYGAYALERWPGTMATACLSRVCEHLEELAVPQEVGISWPTAESNLHPDERRSFPHGMFNLGVAHGVPGVLPVLAQAAAVGAASDSTRALLHEAVAWLLSRKLPAGDASVFPSAWGPGAEPLPARAAWCYGDPGIAAVLWVTGRAAGVPAWEAEALSLARTAARRAPEAAGVRDACLCHGAAGLGHLFNRLHQATGDPELLAAAREWMRRALDLLEPGRGIGGSVTWGPDATGAMDWRDEPSVLTGAAGVALALLAATSPVEPAWDRFLLLSPVGMDARGPSPGRTSWP
jgi:lantibiotic biosynthesis protein